MNCYSRSQIDKLFLRNNIIFCNVCSFSYIFGEIQTEFVTSKYTSVKF